MTKEEIYSSWAPDGALWSRWVKPVLFAAMDETAPSEPTAAIPDVSWVPSPEANVPLVIDLPGSMGVEWGLALAAVGYRPIPLYNAVPGPAGQLQPDEGEPPPPQPLPEISLVDVRPILAALAHGAQKLRDLAIRPDAPPAFLLDADRRIGRGAPEPGRFDNRSISFPTDFPSANFLLSLRISRAIVVQMTAESPQADLAHTLRRWQDAGIENHLKALKGEKDPARIEVTKPSAFGRAWYRFLEMLGLRRQPLGGFGGEIPEASSG
jgi:hypothetical protein